MPNQHSCLCAWVGFDSDHRLILDPELTRSLLAIVNYCWDLIKINEDTECLIDDLELVEEMINIDYYNNKCGE